MAGSPLARSTTGRVGTPTAGLYTGAVQALNASTIRARTPN